MRNMEAKLHEQERLKGMGERVKAGRERLGWSLDQLATRTGVSKPHLSRIERGETDITSSIQIRLVTGLGISLDELVWGCPFRPADPETLRKEERELVNRIRGFDPSGRLLLKVQQIVPILAS